MKNNFNQMFLKKFKIPYIIAEVGNNHNGSLLLAKKIVIEAKKAGANCVKFQSFNDTNLFSKNFLNKNTKIKRDIKKYTLKLDEFKKIYNFCKKLKIDFCSTCFSIDEVKFFMKNTKVKFFKIASMDLNNYQLVEFIAKQKKPIVLSTGLATKKEIRNAVKLIKKYNKKLIVLHCVSNYPPKIEDLNLLRIKELSKTFNIPTGFSDHYAGITASIGAISNGARLIEKHFTINKKMDGWDHKISADYNELKTICEFAKSFQKIQGNKTLKRLEKEAQVKIFRRGVYLNKNKAKGSILKKEDIIFLRPENDISPWKYKIILGKKLKKNKIKDEPIYKNDLV